MHFMNDSFVNLGDEVILTLLWKSGASESVTVSMLYLLLTVQMQRFACLVCMHALVCVCVCVREREQSVQRTRNRLDCGLCANTYKHHHCVCHATLFPSRAWTDGKTKDIINCLYFSFESWSSWLWKGELHFQLVVFGQSQCTVPVGQSEQTALVGRRDFVKN